MHRNDDRVGVHMRVGVHRIEHGQPRASHPQGSAAQHLLEVLAVSHPPQSVPLSGSSQD